MDEYCRAMKNTWNDEAMHNKFSLALNCDNIINSLQPGIINAQSTLNIVKISKKYSFKLFNMTRLMVNLGSKFEINRKLK